MRSGLFQVVAIAMVIVLLWHRLTWGLAEWVHEITFYNFWRGTYVVISGSVLLAITFLLLLLHQIVLAVSAAILLGLTCVAGYYAIVKRSICWLLLVSFCDSYRQIAYIGLFCLFPAH